MTEHKCFVFTFADIKVREREFSIVKAGEVLPVEPKAFRVLLFLLRNPHRLIPKDELLDAVWNEVAVSENSLTRSIALLRRLLGDDTREPRYIATVPTVGYRFLCDVVIEQDGLAQTAALENVQSADAADGPPSGNTLRYGLIAAALVVVVAGSLAWRSARNHDARDPQAQTAVASANSPKNMRIVPLTNLPGEASGPDFSPDGEKIAFIWNGDNPVGGDVYVQLVGAEKPLRLTHTASGFVCCANWSPDGRQIAFGRCDDDGGAVYTVPALGGPERKLTNVVCTYTNAGYPQWTADQKSLILADSCVAGGPRGIVLFSLETGEKRCLTSPPSFSEEGDHAPALSPDQKTVLFLRNVNAPEIYTVALSGENLRQITNEGAGAWSPMWSSDGQHIIFNSPRSGLFRAWRIPASGEAIEPETVYPSTGALSRDGRRLAYNRENLGFWSESLAIWRMTLSSDGGQVISQKQIIDSDGGNASPQPSPDGRQLIFQSGRTSRQQIWRTDADGGNPLQMTFFDTGFSGTPRWSSDSKWIAFDHHPASHAQIYVMDSEGRNQHMITSGNYENVVPSWSRDGKAVYFAANPSGRWQVWKHDLATGRETQVTHHGGFAAFESYDGKTLYYSKFEGNGIWSVPVGGGEERQITGALHRGFWGHFAVTETGIYLVDTEASSSPAIMFYDFQTKLLTPVSHLQRPPVPFAPNLAASRDGRTVFFTEGNNHASITMVENFQ